MVIADALGFLRNNGTFLHTKCILLLDTYFHGYYGLKHIQL